MEQLEDGRELDYIKDIKKLVRRIEYASIFPPKTLNELEKSIIAFDEVQKNEQGNLTIIDALLFPGGKIVSSGLNVRKQVLEDGCLNHLILLEFLEIF